MHLAAVVACVALSFVGAASPLGPRGQREWVANLLGDSHTDMFTSLHPSDFGTFDSSLFPDGALLTHQRKKGLMQEGEGQLTKEERLDDFIEHMMSCPLGTAANLGTIMGVSVAVVHGNETYTKGYGLRFQNVLQTEGAPASLPVDADTLFGIGSLSKGMTAALVASLEQEGLANWDDKLRDYLPEFRVLNGDNNGRQTAKKTRLRDLVSHMTGITDNLLYYLSNPTELEEPRDVARHQGNFEPAQFYREKYLYSNGAFSLAGEAAAAVLNTTWEYAMQSRIWAPLGMTTATSDVNKAIETGNYAFPYGVFPTAQGVLAFPAPQDYAKITKNVAPAGGVIASANDLAKWMRFLIDAGSVNDSPVIAPEFIETIFTPDAYQRAYDYLSSGFSVDVLRRPHFPAAYITSDYSLGFGRGVYRDYITDMHGGDTPSSWARILLMREADFGVSTAVTGFIYGAQLIRSLIVMYAADLYLGFEPWLTKENVCNFPCTFVECAAPAPSITTYDITAEEAEDYIGTYHERGWGDIRIDYSEEAQRLTFEYNDLTGLLGFLSPGNSFTPDYFAASFTGAEAIIFSPLPFSDATFTRNPNGSVDTFTVTNFESVSPPTFTKVY